MEEIFELFVEVVDEFNELNHKANCSDLYLKDESVALMKVEILRH